MMTKREVYELCKTHFPNCGCGSPEGVARLIRDVLIGFKGDIDYEKMKAILPGVYGDNENFGEWFLLYVIDASGLIEHGCSVRGSWLTPKGKGFVAAIETYEDWEDLMQGTIEFECEGQDEVPHYEEGGGPVPNWNGAP